jgi:hypothetical protein
MRLGAPGNDWDRVVSGSKKEIKQAAKTHTAGRKSQSLPRLVL